jgi:hypothetical protein
MGYVIPGSELEGGYPGNGFDVGVISSVLIVCNGTGGVCRCEALCLTVWSDP